LPLFAKDKVDVTELETKHFYSWTINFFVHEKRATIESFGTKIVLFSNHYYKSSITRHKYLPEIEQVINE